MVVEAAFAHFSSRHIFVLIVYSTETVKYWIEKISGNTFRKETNWRLWCCCNDNSFAAGSFLIKTEIHSWQGELLQYGNHDCSGQDLLPHFKRLQMEIFGFW